MKYRIFATLALLAVLGVCYVVFGQSESTTDAVPDPSMVVPSEPTDAAAQGLSIN